MEQTFPNWIEHWQIVQWLLASSALVIMWFITKQLRDIEKSHEDSVKIIAELYDRIHALEKDFYILQGSHIAHHGRDNHL